ncbi:MAG: hypothetical protein HYV29_09670 [Ignavibacteriales bacterium]|nr:hypothetical protein [Ignavibacteriales bacterium]
MTKQILSTALFSIILLHTCDVTISTAQTSTGRYLLLKPSAESNGMGGTGVAMERSPFASYFNPAALAFSPSISFAGSLGNPIPFFENIKHSYITGSVHLSGSTTIGGSANLYWKGRHAITSERNEDILSAEDIMDWEAKLSFGHTPSDDFSIGVNIGILQLNLSGIGTGTEQGKGRSTSVVVEGGILYRNFAQEATFVSEQDETEKPLSALSDPYVHTGFSFGAALTNAGPQITFIDPAQSDPLPTTLTFGYAYSPVRTYWIGAMLAIDAEEQFSEYSFVDYLHLGTEITLVRIVAARIGYVKDIAGPRNSYWTYGAGLKLKFLHINYARFTRALIPSWHLDGAFIWEL